MGVHWDYNRLVASQASFIYTQGQNAKRSKKNLKSTTNSSHPKDKKICKDKTIIAKDAALKEDSHSINFIL